MATCLLLSAAGAAPSARLVEHDERRAARQISLPAERRCTERTRRLATRSTRYDEFMAFI